MQITVNESDLAFLLPVEVGGFFIKRLGVQRGDWVLTTTTDNVATFAAHLSQRGPVPVNMVVGMTHLGSNQVSFVLQRKEICVRNASCKRELFLVFHLHSFHIRLPAFQHK